MKKFTFLFAMLLSISVYAQDNSWEQDNSIEAKAKADAKYLVGAVPEVDGKVVFEKTIQAPGKSRQQIYDLLLADFTKMTKESNQFEQSRIVLKDSVGKTQIIASYQEWLVFKNKPLSLDRTRLFYHLFADIQDGTATVKMTRIYYLYEEERNPMTFKAEECITDRYGLKRNQKKLSRVYGKFRKKTIDRKDYIFNRLEQLLNK